MRCHHDVVYDACIACVTMQMEAALLTSELDCQTMEQALQQGHYGCLKHICSAEPGSRLEYDDQELETTPLQDIEHRSDKSCTAIVHLLLSTCADEQMELYRDETNDLWHSALRTTVSSRNAEVELCYGCMSALLEAGIGNDADCNDMDNFVAQYLFDCRR